MTKNNARFILLVAADYYGEQYSSALDFDEALTTDQLCRSIGYEAAWAAYKLRGTLLSRKYTDELGVTLTRDDRKELMNLAKPLTNADYDLVIGPTILALYGKGLVHGKGHVKGAKEICTKAEFEAIKEKAEAKRKSNGDNTATVGQAGEALIFISGVLKDIFS